jgi:YHS domain-containing protein
MNFLARIARFLFWLLILSWAVWLIRSLAARAIGKAPRSGERVGQAGAEVSRRLHRDPVCGMHVSEDISIVGEQGGETLHFCSAECRDRYLRSQPKAANG